MKLSDNILTEFKRCFAAPVPFALWRRPRQPGVSFMADEAYGSPAPEGAEQFVVAPWLGSELPPICARKAETAPAKSHIPSVEAATTDKAQYISSVRELIEEHKIHGSKTVVSRTTVIPARIGPEEALNIFGALAESNPEAFVYLYFTPTTGYWIGATPELLLSTSDGGHRAHSMALAGTRPGGTKDPWDKKNIDEQAIVREFVADTFHRHCTGVEVHPAETLRAGRVEHICNRIDGVLPDSVAAEALVRDLNPTPAVCGFPREEALRRIARTEIHNRGCYSGYVGIRSHADAELYVNLRCAAIDRSKACIYSGGGITAASDPAAEWEESRLKANQLKQLFSQYSRR